MSADEAITPRLLNVAQTAAYLGLAEQTVRNRAYEIPGRRKIGRRLLFDRVALDRWIDRGDPIRDLFIDARQAIR